MTKQLLLSGLALATLALNACSSEPSDWRPDKKVSLDMIAPGTRSDQYFDAEEKTPETEANAAAIPRPINSEVTLDERAMPPAGETMSENAPAIKEEYSERAAEKVKAKTEKKAAEKK